MLVSSVPKIYDCIKDYKKILFNNLLRSYKILINIVNNFIFGKENIDLILKIRNNEFIQDNTFEEIICRNHDMISDIYMKFDSILIEIKIQVFIVDQNIAEKLAGMIMDNMYNILKVLKNELIKKLHYQNSLNILENEKKKNFSGIVEKKVMEITNDAINPYKIIYQKLIDFIEGELINLNLIKIKEEILKNK
jgi:hypothetical protein